MERFAYTSTFIPKKEGEAVTVLYDPSDPAKPKLRAFDEAWAMIAIWVIAASGTLSTAHVIFTRYKIL